MSARYVWDAQLKRRVPAPGWEGDTSTALADMTGREIRVGMWLAHPVHDGNMVNLQVRIVGRIKNDKVYFGTSRTPISYPGRCLIVDREITEMAGQVSTPED